MAFQWMMPSFFLDRLGGDWIPAGGWVGFGLGAVKVMSVNEIPDDELLRRAVTSCRANVPKHRAHYRWVAVMETFGLGSGYSMELCERFGLNPDELVKRD